MFSRYDLDDNSIIFLYPFLFRANNGNRPIVSSNLKFICVPIIGCVPILDIFSENSRAPQRFEVSDKPTHAIFFSLQKSFKLSILIAPSQIEY